MTHPLFNILTAVALLLIFSAALMPVDANAEGQSDPSTSADESNEKTISLVGRVDPIIYLTIFVLAVFVGFEIITKIPPTLHTPLMSGSNAISGITLVGAILCGKTDSPYLTVTLGFLAVVFASLNAVGGFLVTHRMLSMFRRKS